MGTPINAAQFSPALMALLGLPKHCTQFELRVRYDQIVTIACEYYPNFDAQGIVDLATVFGEFELVARELAPAKIENFDAWIRDRTDRTDRAHAEYMAGHAAGGIDYGAP